MAQVKFIGPDGSLNRDIGAETGEGDLLEPGRTYEVSEELAKKLLKSAQFEKAEKVKRYA